MPTPLFKNDINRAFTCVSWLPTEYAIITGVSRGRVSYIRYNESDPEIAHHMSTTSFTLNNMLTGGSCSWKKVNA